MHALDRAHAARPPSLQDSLAPRDSRPGPSQFSHARQDRMRRRATHRRSTHVRSVATMATVYRPGRAAIMTLPCRAAPVTRTHAARTGPGDPPRRHPKGPDRHGTRQFIVALGRAWAIIADVKAPLLAIALAVALLPIDARAERKEPAISTVNMPPGWQWPPSPAMRYSGDRCIAALADAGVAFHVSPRSPGKIATPVIVPSMTFGALSVRQIHGRQAPVMDCHMALALAQHADLLSELGVRELVVAGFYQNRRARLRGRSVALLSRHALGLAVDIRAFSMADGRTLSVKDDYQEPVLGQLEQALAGSGQLRAVVTPGNDPAHRDHFHISAMMTIDPMEPDTFVQMEDLLAQLRVDTGRAQRDRTRTRRRTRAQRPGKHRTPPELTP